MISIKERLIETGYDPGNLQNGLRASIFHEFYNQVEHWVCLPYQSDEGGGVISIRKVLDGMIWPSNSDFIPLNNEPNDQTTAYSENVQGAAAYKDKYLVFSQYIDESNGRNRRLVFWPLPGPLIGQQPLRYYTIKSSDVPIAQKHPGSPDINNNLLIIPMDEAIPPGIVSYELTDNSPYINIVKFSAYPKTSPQGLKTDTNPWCAFANNKQCILSSKFYPESTSETGNKIYFYNFTNSMIEILPLIGEFSLKDSSGLSSVNLRRIQSGKVSINGHLWLLSDIESNNGGGLYGFCLITGKLKIYLPINGGGLNRELEGVFFHYFDPVHNPYSKYGLMHVVVLNNDAFESDNTYVLHWDIKETRRSYV